MTESRPTTQTTSGPVTGTIERKVASFKGIPYATARRFRLPDPPSSWTEARDCSAYGPICPSSDFGMDAAMGLGDSPLSDDPLSLNVWTPACDDGGRPVIVWIHGGAYFSGASGIPWYNGGGLARTGDAVVISINYRFGAFGFLYLDHLDSELAGSGSLGIADMMAALRWVQDNAAAFGGDPDQVTVMGQSAGAFAVSTMLGLPAASGLFSRAILLSGAARVVFHPEEAAEITTELLGHLGISADADGVRQLEALPLADLHAAQSKVVVDRFERALEVTRPGSLAIPFQPVVDGVVIDRHPLDGLAEGVNGHVPVLTGTTADEMRMFTMFSPRVAGLSDYEIVDLLVEMLGPRARHLHATYASTRPTASALDVANDIIGDYVFRLPAIELAEVHGRYQPDVWMYRFDRHQSPMGLDMRAFHGAELIYVFDNTRMPGIEAFHGGDKAEAEQLGAMVAGAILAFAHNGDPNHEGLPAWPRYDTDARPTMILDLEPRLEHDPAADERRLWDAAAADGPARRA